MKTEAPIRVKDYRAKHGLKPGMMSAIASAMKLPRRCRFVTESDVNKWRRDHPEFRVTDVYPRKKKQAT